MTNEQEMIQSLKYVSEHLTEETDKEIINNCILLLQELRGIKYVKNNITSDSTV